MTNILQRIFNGIIGILLIIGAFWYISDNWQYWTQSVDGWKALCMFPETNPQHMQTVSDYRSCLSRRHITPTEADIRKMCNSLTQEEYQVQNSKDPSQETLYSRCLHEEGLSG